MMSNKPILLIPAAGRGTRLAKAGARPKALSSLGEATLIECIYNMWSEHVTAVVIAVPTGFVPLFASTLKGRTCTFVECPPNGDFIDTLVQLVTKVTETQSAVIVLGDDFSIIQNPIDLLAPIYNGALASQAVVLERSQFAITNACEVSLSGAWITRVLEKRCSQTPAWRGCGMYCLSARAVSLLMSKPNHLSYAFDEWALAGEQIAGVPLIANANVNSPEDLEDARGLYRLLASSRPHGDHL